MTAPALDPGARQASKRDLAVALLFGGACHLLFALGVGTMMAAMAFGMGRCLGRVPSPWAVLADAALLLQFPLLHSLLLARPGRRWMARLAPFGLGPRLSTTTYVILASLQTGLLFALWTPSGTLWWRAEGAALAALCTLYAASWLLLLKSIVDAGLPLQVGLLGWWAVARGRAPVYPPMPRRGLFRLCRQPIYLSFTLTLWTVPTWTPDQLCVALVLTAYCVSGPLLKEARFGRSFGAEFAGYRRGVPYFLPRMPWRPRRASPASRLDLAVRHDPDRRRERDEIL